MEFKPIASSSRGNCYLLKSPGVPSLLVEAGIPVRRIREALGFTLSDITGVLVTHCHGDHASGVKDILKAGIDVWTSIETAEAIGIAGHYRLNELTSGVTASIGTWIVLPFDLHHDVPTQGFFIQAPDGDRLLFIPDTSYIRNRFENVTILVIEANHGADILSENIQSGTVPVPLGRRVRRNHLSLSVVKDFILANNMQKTLREIHLIHLSDSNSSEQQFKREIQEITGVPVYVAAS